MDVTVTVQNISRYNLNGVIPQKKVDVLQLTSEILNPSLDIKGYDFSRSWYLAL